MSFENSFEFFRTKHRFFFVCVLDLNITGHDTAATLSSLVHVEELKRLNEVESNCR
jgi:hypothetical protein